MNRIFLITNADRRSFDVKKQVTTVFRDRDHPVTEPNPESGSGVIPNPPRPSGGPPCYLIRKPLGLEYWNRFTIHIETAPIDGKPDHSVQLETVLVSVIDGDGKTVFRTQSPTNIPRGNSHVFGLEVSAATVSKYFVPGNSIQVFAQTDSPVKGWVRFGFSSNER